MAALNIDEDFHRWFESEFADNIDEGSRTHTNLHCAFEAGVNLGVEKKANCTCPDTVLAKKLLAGFIDHGGIPNWVFDLTKER